MGLEIGCEAVFDPVKKDPFSTLLEVDPHGPTVAFECSGVPGALQQTIDACGPTGTIGVLGVPMDPVLLLRMFVREQRAFSLSGPSWESMLHAQRLLVDRPQTAKIITGEVPLEETERTFNDLAEGRGGIKVLVAPEP
jgi:threonine dehydrogenase-like Zn-dependent dehydrogenase